MLGLLGLNNALQRDVDGEAALAAVPRTEVPGVPFRGAGSTAPSVHFMAQVWNTVGMGPVWSRCAASLPLPEVSLHCRGLVLAAALAVAAPGCCARSCGRRCPRRRCQRPLRRYLRLPLR